MTESVVDYGLTRDGVVQLRRRWPAARPDAVMLLLHGIAEHSGRYDRFGRTLAAAGIDVVAIDHRGFGESGGRRASISSFRQYLDDTQDQLAELRKLGLPVVLFGHSMGGLVALAYVLEHRPAPELLVLSGPALDADVPRPLRLLAPVAGRLAPRLRVASPIAFERVATDPAVGRALADDPLVEGTVTARLGAELFREMTWAKRNLCELTVPTLVVHGEKDAIVPSEMSRQLVAMPCVERRELPGLGHEVLNEPVGAELAGEIAEWVRSHLGLA